MNPLQQAIFSAQVEYLRLNVELVRPVRVPPYIEDLYSMAEIQQREDAQAARRARVPEPQSQGPRMRPPPRRTTPERPVSGASHYTIPPRFYGKRFPKRGGWNSNYSPRYAQERSFPPDGNQFRPRPSYAKDNSYARDNRKFPRRDTFNHEPIPEEHEVVSYPRYEPRTYIGPKRNCMTPKDSQRPAPNQKATQEATASVSRNAVPEIETRSAEPRIIVKQTQKKRRKKRRKKKVPKTTLCEETSASNNEASVDSKPSTTKQSEAGYPEKQE